ncbi:MAG TPA: hypothetical protein VLG10_06920 [Methylomirabilota bacterium]|nr:hypothetical protein [Methylomirabilota bacterium]
MSRVRLLASTLLVLGLVAPALAHHVGSYTPRDNEVSANFKQLKFSIQAGRFDVARRLYETGALRRELQVQAGRLPAGLDEAIGAALQRGDGQEAERGLMVFFVALVRDLVLEADRQVSDPTTAVQARAAAGRKFLDAIWRYYNLIDFALSQRDPKASADMRLAFDEAEGYLKPGPAPALDKVRPPLQQMARILTDVIQASSSSTRRES